ncbi:MAG: HAD family hydrolase [Candidatus Hydrogenedentes bacterium]|nr:HAD family hydrolase [Candidatus Hydrogenedentota bacterium]
MSQHPLHGLDVQLINPDIPVGKIKHALFDFDGTISLLREGWPEIMAPVCVELICGDTAPTPAIEAEVAQMIDETTGIQTILQMERLVEMIREHGLVPEDRIPDAHACKQVYLDRLMVPVRERIARLESGALSVEEVTVRGVFRFLELLAERGVTLYVFSGTDRDDVRNEAAKVGAAPYFKEIWGALRTVEEYSKEQVIRDVIAEHDLHGSEILAVGDGPVELRNVKAVGGIALGVASDELRGHGWDHSKTARLTKAGADILIPDFTHADELVAFLFAEGPATA